MDIALARRMEVVRASDIRELLKLTSRPSVISFAGGLPAAELFPAAEIAEAATRVLLEHGARPCSTRRPRVTRRCAPSSPSA